MRKLKRCVERNQKGKRTVGKAAAAVLAASMAMSSTPMLGYAKEATQVTGESPVEEGDLTTDNIESNDDTKSSGAETDGEEDNQVGNNENNNDAAQNETADDEKLDEQSQEGIEDEELLDEELLLQQELLMQPLLSATPTDSHDIYPGDCTIENNRISVKITEDGEYYLTGSNEIGGAYVDVQIEIESGVKADLHLDGFHIFNDDCIDGSTKTTTDGRTDSISPFYINGGAEVNIYVESDSSISAVTEHFVNGGKLRFAASNGDAELEIATSLSPEKTMGQSYFGGSGDVIFGNANVVFLANNVYMDILGWNSKGYIEEKAPVIGKKINTNNIVWRLPNYYYKGSLPEGSMVHGIIDGDGGELQSASQFAGKGPFVSGNTIVQINDAVFKSGLECDADGNVDAQLFLPYYNSAYIYVTSGGNRLCYKFDAESENSFELQNFYSVTFKKENGEIMEDDSYDALAGTEIKLPKGNYSFTLEDGTVVDKDTIVESDMTVIVKEKTGKCTVTINQADGTTKNYEADVNASGSLSARGIATANAVLLEHYDEDGETKYKLVYGSDDIEIIEDTTFDLLSVTYSTDSKNSKWLDIDDKAELCEFSKIVNCGNTKVNAKLTNDIQFDVQNEFIPIGNVIAKNVVETVESYYEPYEINYTSYDSTNSFRGIFDGQGHTVEVHIGTSGSSSASDLLGTGLFGAVTDGAQIRNVNVAGEIIGAEAVGGIVGCVVNKAKGGATIEKCINSSNITTKTKVDRGAAGIVGRYIGQIFNGEIASATDKVVIFNCANTGNINFSENSSGGCPYGMISSMDAGVIEITNCYSTKEYSLTFNEGTNYRIDNSYILGNDTTEADFASGKVTYLLNKKNTENPVWHQKCGEGLPSLSGSDVVYAGYVDCSTKELSYSNEPFSHTKEGHKSSGEFSYANGQINGVCEFCIDGVTADVDFSADYYGEADGVNIEYSNEWTKAEYPEISFKYSEELDGVYSAELPTEIGDWYVKAFVIGTDVEIPLLDTYSIISKPIEKPVEESQKEEPQKEEPKQDEKKIQPAVAKQETQKTESSQTHSNGSSESRASVESSTVMQQSPQTINSVVWKKAETALANYNKPTFSLNMAGSTDVDSSVLAKMHAKNIKRADLIMDNKTAVTISPSISKTVNGVPFVLRVASNTLADFTSKKVAKLAVSADAISKVGGDNTSRVVVISTNNTNAKEHCAMSFARQKPSATGVKLYMVNPVNGQLVFVGEKKYNNNSLLNFDLICFNCVFVAVEV